jgi:hypothetical protein
MGWIAILFCLIGWVANLFCLVGLIALGRKHRVGFVLCTIADVYYAGLGAYYDLWDLFALNVALILVNIWGWRQWGHK